MGSKLFQWLKVNKSKTKSDTGQSSADESKFEVSLVEGEFGPAESAEVSAVPTQL